MQILTKWYNPCIMIGDTEPTFTIPSVLRFHGIDLSIKEIPNLLKYQEFKRWMPEKGFNTHSDRNYCNECESGYGGWIKLVENPNIFDEVVRVTSQKVMYVEQFNLLTMVIQKLLENRVWQPQLTDGLVVSGNEHPIAYKGPSSLFRGSIVNGLVKLPQSDQLLVVSPIVTGLVYFQAERKAFVFPEFTFKDEMTEDTQGFAIAIRQARLKPDDIPYVNFY